uniref:Uncharacterized protein n=1 Tax=Rhizophora mucronata TaxID=61149 RepID=A0A2P2NUK5_RHIMU
MIMSPIKFKSEVGFVLNELVDNDENEPCLNLSFWDIKVIRHEIGLHCSVTWKSLTCLMTYYLLILFDRSLNIL